MKGNLHLSFSTGLPAPLLALILLALMPTVSSANTEGVSHPLRLTVLPVRSGMLEFTLAGRVAREYEIEASVDLLHWETIATNTLRSSPQIVASLPVVIPQRFFRAKDTLRPGFVAGEILIEFRPDAPAADRARAVAELGLREQEVVLTPVMAAAGCQPVHCCRVALPVPEALQRLRTNACIAAVQPNWLYAPAAEANDPLFDLQWGLRPSGGLDAAAFWNRGHTGSAEVCVGLIDTGVQISHPDLGRNIWINPREIPGNQQDDDGNGFVDDLHGWNFVDCNNVIESSADVHGTLVAGVIGAVGGNGIGVAGVNWAVSLIPVKMNSGTTAGETLNAIRAIDYFIALKNSQHLNLVAINCSWGSYGYDALLHAAVIRAAKADTIVVAAAGNDGLNTDVTPFFPASLDTRLAPPGTEPATWNAVISVAAHGPDGSLWVWSNCGRRSVTLAAPGTNIWTTAPGGAYNEAVGTSLAAGFVTGAVALLASADPTRMTGFRLREALIGGIVPSAQLSGAVVTGGKPYLSITLLRNHLGRVWMVDQANGTPPWLGTPQDPFRLVTDAYAAAEEGDRLRFRSGTYRPFSRMTKRVRLEAEAEAGAVKIGQP